MSLCEFVYTQYMIVVSHTHEEAGVAASADDPPQACCQTTNRQWRGETEENTTTETQPIHTFYILTRGTVSRSNVPMHVDSSDVLLPCTLLVAAVWVQPCFTRSHYSSLLLLPFSQRHTTFIEVRVFAATFCTCFCLCVHSVRFLADSMLLNLPAAC